MPSDWSLSVSQLNEYVRKALAGDPMLQNIRVTGEISGFKRHFSGHLYFTLKDEGARVKCVMFRSAAAGLPFVPEDGMRVIVSGSASLYTQSGEFQLYVSDIRRQGVGELYQRYEALKARLAAEGLFDQALKRELPLRPRVVGVATSRTGAVLRDICTVARRRDPRVDILLSPCAVQGAGAAEEIARAIDRLNEQGEYDVILCGRGGGSIEDLWAFNEEVVARAIRRSRVPVVSCVGHETDFTIADFAADVRAATPSAAAELAVPDVAALTRGVTALLQRAAAALSASLSLRRKSLERLTASRALSRPREALIDGRRDRLCELHRRLDAAFTQPARDRRARLERIGDALRRAPATIVPPRRAALEALTARLTRQGELLTARPQAQLTALTRALRAIDPSAVLRRGYAVVSRGGRAVGEAAALKSGDEIGIRFSDGAVSARVTDERQEE